MMYRKIVIFVLGLFLLATSFGTTAFAQTAPTGLNADLLFSMVNNYRAQRNLPAFQKNDLTCNLAASRAPEIYNEVFVTGRMHAGLRARHLPYFDNENIIYMNSEAAALNWWVNDYIHWKAIVGNYVYSCISCSGFACAEEFTNNSTATQ